jgi:hypothetical protein
MNNITVSAISKDSTRVFLTPEGDTTRGVWWPVGESLETLRFPAVPAPLPKLYSAAWGEGKGIKGGFSSLRG